MSQSSRTLGLPDAGILSACACADKEARFQLDDRIFSGQFEGSIAVMVGEGSATERGVTIPLNIIGYTTTSRVKGMGRTTLDFDFDRSIQASRLESSDRKKFFPATQTMLLNILMTTEAFPGVTLRSMSRGALVNNQATSFPPRPGSVYTLQKPVDLEDPREPGKARVRILSVNTEITSATSPPKNVEVGTGIVIYPSTADRYIYRTPSAKTVIKFKLPEAGSVRIPLLDARGGEVTTALDERLKAGRHTVNVDLSQLRAKNLFYQIQVDGRNRTARMPLVMSNGS